MIAAIYARKSTDQNLPDEEKAAPARSSGPAPMPCARAGLSPTPTSTPTTGSPARIMVQLERCSEYQHRMARRARVLREAATQLRLGRMSTAVLALIQEQVPEAVLVSQPDDQEEE